MTDQVLEQLGRHLGSAARRNTWHDDPAGFARDCVRWPVIRGEQTGLVDYQARILTSLLSKRTAFRAPRGGGKTLTEALSVLWFALTRDAARDNWRCLTTSGSWQQLAEHLWPEIRLWSGRLDWEKLGRAPFTENELQSLHLKLRYGHAYSGSPNKAGLAEGLHSDHLLILLDEAKLISTDLFDSIEGSFSSPGEKLMLAGSTAGETEGRFYEICSRSKGTEHWEAVHITRDMTLSAGRMDPEWEREMRSLWGVDSTPYRNYVLAEFASADQDSVIPLSWVEAAIERWRAWDADGRSSQPGREIVGVDVADAGADRTVLAIRKGDVVERLERFAEGDTMATVGRVVQALSHPQSLAVIDSVGIGAGVLARLKELHKPARGFNAGERSTRADRTNTFGFVNQRSEAWWRMREMLDPSAGATLALPDDAELIGDLTAPRWRVASNGKVAIEEKREIRKRLRRSTDTGDAVVQTLSAYSGSYAADSDDTPAVLAWDDSVPTADSGVVAWEEDDHDDTSARVSPMWPGFPGW
ncbi:MAG: hypothetical protein ACRENY_02340 [Candidatus Dormibacteria bacterium]